MHNSPLKDPVPCKPQLRRNKPGSRLQPPKLQPGSKIPAKTLKPATPLTAKPSKPLSEQYTGHVTNKPATRPSLVKPAPSAQKKLQKRANSAVLPTPQTRPHARPSLPARTGFPVSNPPVNTPANPPSKPLVTVTTKPGTIPTVKPGNVPTPKPGNVHIAKPGNVPTAKPSNVPVTKPGNVPVTKPGNVPITKQSNVPTTKKPVEPPEHETSGDPHAKGETCSAGDPPVTGETCPTPPPRRGPSLTRTTTTLKKLPKKAPINNYETLDRRHDAGEMKRKIAGKPRITDVRKSAPISQPRAAPKSKISTNQSPLSRSHDPPPANQSVPKSKMLAKPAVNSKLVRSGIPGPGSKKLSAPPRDNVVLPSQGSVYKSHDNAVKYKEPVNKPLSMQKSHSKESLQTPDNSFIRRNSLPVTMLEKPRSLSSRSSRSKISNRSLCSTPCSQVSLSEAEIEDCEMNNLSIMNKSPTHELNIPSPDNLPLEPINHSPVYKSHDNLPLEPAARISKSPTEYITEDRISNLDPTEDHISNLDYDKAPGETFKDCNLEIVINNIDNKCTDQLWDNDNTYTSPDDNEELSDHELYYQSSELDSGPSVESLHDKEINNCGKYTPSEEKYPDNLSNSLKDKDVTKDVCLASVLKSPCGDIIDKEACEIKEPHPHADKCNQTSPFTDTLMDPLANHRIIEQLSCINAVPCNDLVTSHQLESDKVIEDTDSCIELNDTETSSIIEEEEEYTESSSMREEDEEEEGIDYKLDDLEEVDSLTQLEEVFDSCVGLGGELKEEDDEDEDDVPIPLFPDNSEKDAGLEVANVTASAPVSPHSAQVDITTRADSEPSTPNPDISIEPPFLHNPRLSNFKRSQRSITPRRTPGVLLRSVSLPKKHSARLTPAEYEQHLKNLKSLEYMEPPGNFCIVEGLLSPQPSSYRLVCPPAAAPEIMVTEPIRGHMTEPRMPYHRIQSPKEKHSKVIRRFSESQVFKHHKDKYMKKRQQEEKHSSCPVESVCGKPDSPNNNNRMNKFVKRVSSLLNPGVKPRPLGMRDEDGGGFFSSMLSLNMESVARSLHDDLPDGPALAHQALSGEKNSFKRSNSLELDESTISGIRRTPSDRSDATESDVVLREPSKAKSITEQLERYGLYGLTQFDTQFEGTREEFNIELESSWQEIVSIECQNNLTTREKEQQEAIWELFSTEHNYLNNLSTCVQTFLNCLRKLKHEKFLSDINVEDLFLNIELIYEINLKFWKDCLEPCLNEARANSSPLNPQLITEGYVYEERFHPYLEYCLKHAGRIVYLDSKMKKHSDFKEYITWCENQLRSTTRLGLKDMLVKPFQRITKYPLLIKQIQKKTTDDDHSTALKSMLDKIVGFVQSLNRQMQEQEDQRSLKEIMNKIEGYNVFSPPNSTHSHDRIEQVLAQYNRLDLLAPVPVLGCQRRFIGESSSKMSTFQDRPFECHLFLFTDMLLVTKSAKKRDKKFTVVKQPLSIDPDKLKVTELDELSHSLLMVYLNEFGSAVDSFLLSSSSRESHLSFLNSISTAQDKFNEQKLKKLTETDSSKAHLSNLSMDSYTSLHSPDHLRLGCSITRSSSENYNNRRTDTTTSVARAQSMPASNDKRPQTDCLASSSASSSETSGSLLSVNSSAKSSSIALSEIKENEINDELSLQNLDSGDEQTVISDKCEKCTDNRTDSYISDNLCSDLKYKIDIDKTVLVSQQDNDLKNQDIYNIDKL